MKAYEYYAEILPDGHLPIPENLQEQLRPDSRVRVMLLLEDEDVAWEEFTTRQFSRGYSDQDSMYDRV